MSVSVSKCRCGDDGFGMCSNCAHWFGRMWEREDDVSWSPVVELNRKAQPLYRWGLAWVWHPLTAVRYVD